MCIGYRKQQSVLLTFYDMHPLHGIVIVPAYCFKICQLVTDKRDYLIMKLFL